MEGLSGGLASLGRKSMACGWRAVAQASRWREESSRASLDCGSCLGKLRLTGGQAERSGPTPQ
jgi:hypothetical protein